MSEASEIKRDNARAVKNSGRGHYVKGDAILDIFTIDYKEYPKGYRVDMKNWAKICSDAIRNRTVPMLKIVMGEGNHKVRLCVVEEEVMDDYIRLRQLEEEWSK